MMNDAARKYLGDTFSDLINYETPDPLQPIDPVAYRTPEGDSCLHIAAARGNLAAVELLVDAGLDVDLRGDLGNTPLHYARKSRHENVVQFLVNRGASPQVVNELGEKAL